jgi:hypothetical protein
MRREPVTINGKTYEMQELATVFAYHLTHYGRLVDVLDVCDCFDALEDGRLEVCLVDRDSQKMEDAPIVLRKSDIDVIREMIALLEMASQYYAVSGEMSRYNEARNQAKKIVY